MLNQDDRIKLDPDGKPSIHGILLQDIYRNLNLRGMKEEDLLRQHPGLTQADLIAVHDYIVADIKSRTHDEITGRPILAKDLLTHGRYYKGRCRNGTIARFSAEEQCFFYWRKKFDRIFVQTIKYPTDETDWFLDIFWAVEELVSPRFEIPFDLDATFSGNSDDLVEFNVEMWNRPKK